MTETDIKIDDFDYYLPDDKIARFPLNRRDSSKLLIYEKGRIRETVFSDLPAYFSPDDLLVFNNTKVIQARLLFTKQTGTTVEIFCLEPVDPPDYKSSLQGRSGVVWQCLIGNVKRWKSGILEKSFDPGGRNVTLHAEKTEHQDTIWKIRFTWEPSDLTFADILEKTGLVPIPPYLKREPVPDDKSAYQTVYSVIDGSVAAPTAGFHFTPEIIGRLKEKGVSFSELTLHVGAGTFRPVLATGINQHIMHPEHLYFNRSNLMDLINHNKRITAVGTTSARTLETIYWMGCKVRHYKNTNPRKLAFDQWEEKHLPVLDKPESLETLIEYSEKNDIHEFHVITRLMIIPGYKFHLTDRIITNFHQPRSTLLLMIGAMIGDDWRKVYTYAMNNGFRFLSYGDSSLLMP